MKFCICPVNFISFRTTLCKVVSASGGNRIVSPPSIFIPFSKETLVLILPSGKNNTIVFPFSQSTSPLSAFNVSANSNMRIISCFEKSLKCKKCFNFSPFLPHYNIFFYLILGYFSLACLFCPSLINGSLISLLNNWLYASTLRNVFPNISRFLYSLIASISNSA